MARNISERTTQADGNDLLDLGFSDLRLALIFLVAGLLAAFCRLHHASRTSNKLLRHQQLWLVRRKSGKDILRTEIHMRTRRRSNWRGRWFDVGQKLGLQRESTYADAVKLMQADWVVDR